MGLINMNDKFIHLQLKLIFLSYSKCSKNLTLICSLKLIVFKLEYYHSKLYTNFLMYHLLQFMIDYIRLLPSF